MRIGETHIALGIFKIDRVNFMGHGGRAHFAGDSLLLESNLHGDVTPDIPGKINQDSVGSAPCPSNKLSHIVMGFDLGGVGVERKPEVAR